MSQALAYKGLKACWKMIEKNTVFTFENMEQIKTAFSRMFLRLDELELSRKKWRKRAEEAEAKLKAW